MRFKKLKVSKSAAVLGIVALAFVALNISAAVMKSGGLPFVYPQVTDVDKETTWVTEDVYVTEDPAKTHDGIDAVVLVEGTTGAAGSIRMDYLDPVRTIQSVECWIYLEYTPGENQFCSILLQEAVGDPLTVVNAINQFNGGFGTAWLAVDQLFANRVVGGTLYSGQWSHWKVINNRQLGSYSFYVDGVLQATTPGFNNGYFPNIAWVYCWANTCIVDDIKITFFE